MLNLKKSLSFFSLCLILAVFIILFSATRPAEKTTVEFYPEFPEGCTSILVGKNASSDGSVIVTHAADCGVCDFTWHHVPAADHEEDAVRKIYHIHQIKTWPPEEGGKWGNLEEGYTELDIPQVQHTFAYRFSVFGYMNEHQVSIGEATIGCQRKMMNPTPAAKMDITMLTLLAMERCRTAREAVKLMGSLGEKYGYGYYDSGEMLAVADPHEAWLFEIMPVGPLWTPESGKPGTVWCAQRVPDNHVSVCPNESRIGEINRNDSDHFLYSPNAVSLAVEMGFYDPESGEPFSWKKAYCPTLGSASSSYGRRGRLWRFYSLVAPSKNFSPDLPNMDFPFSVKPDKKMSVQDVMAIHRDKYKGSIFDPAQGIKAGPFSNPNYFRGFRLDKENYTGPRCISVNNVEYTTVAQCRSWLPDPIGGILWVALGAQDTSCFIPFYAGVKALPDSFSVGDHWILNRQSARWAFDYVDFHTQVAYSYAIEDVKKIREEWEGKAFEQIPAIDKVAEGLYNENPEKAATFLTDFCLRHADNVVRAWWDLGDFLLVKYNHFRMYDPETRKTGRMMTPGEWNKAVVLYDKLSPIPQSRERR
ncbi:MAG: C69 family dipeptidase [Candidatus Aminicenantes bacterium]|nr:C69 family dipeptidase [Candidatus Aminicenantes bacterium]